MWGWLSLLSLAQDHETTPPTPATARSLIRGSRALTAPILVGGTSTIKTNLPLWHLHNPTKQTNRAWLNPKANLPRPSNKCTVVKKDQTTMNQRYQNTPHPCLIRFQSHRHRNKLTRHLYDILKKVYSLLRYLVIPRWYQLVYSPLIWKYVWHFWDRNQIYLGT